MSDAKVSDINTSNTEVKDSTTVARVMLAKTIDRVLESLNDKALKNVELISDNHTSLKPAFNYLINAKELLLFINTYLTSEKIPLDTILIEHLRNSNKNISINRENIISFNNYLRETLQYGILSSNVKTLDKLFSIETPLVLERECKELRQKAITFIHEVLIPSLQVPSAMYIKVIKMFNEIAISENKYMANLQDSSRELDKQIEIKLQEYDTLITKINKTDKRINDLADIATGKSAGQIYGEMAKRQEKESAKYRNWTIATLIFTIAVPISSYIIGVCFL